MPSPLSRDADRFFSRWGQSRKPRWMLWIRLLLLTPGFQFVMLLRFQRWLGRLPLVGKALRRFGWYWTTILFSSDVDPEVRIGPGLYVPHPTGIVIGGSVVIGADVSILQNVTLGRTGVEHGDPVICDGCEIGAGAVILGSLRIGRDAKVGANSVVLMDVPDGAVAVGVPARILQHDGDKRPSVGKISPARALAR